ncbi:MAG: glutathione synthase [Sphingomonadaceae bacterium]
MPLKAAFQMDPMERIDIAGDSSFALMLAGQARGAELFHYRPQELNWSDGRLWTRAHPVTVQRAEGDHYRFGEPVTLDLKRDIDVVLMRQDPPFDLSYIPATFLLERLAGETLVVNDPAAVRNAPEKMLVLDYARFMPPTLITRSLDEARSFLSEQAEIVLKPLHGNAGKAIFRIGPDGANLAALMEMFNASHGEPHMAQKFLPEIAEGDKRIILIDGEVAGAVNRFPGKGEIRSNLAVGGRAERAVLTEREREICAAMGPELRKRGLLFVGIDVIGGKWLTEINVTSPTGIVAIDKFDGTDLGAAIWEAIEAKL